MMATRASRSVTGIREKCETIIQVAISDGFANSFAIQLKCRSAFLSDLFLVKIIKSVTLI